MVYQILVGIVAAISGLSTAWLVYTSQKNINILNILMSIILAVSNIGYFLRALSHTLEGALVSNAVSYLGAIFLPLLVMFILADFSDSKLPNWFMFFIVIANLSVHCMVMLNLKFPLYYAAVALKNGPAGDLITIPGVGYMVRIVILIVEVVLSVFFTIITITGRKTASRKTMWMFLGIMIVTLLVYAIEKFTVINFTLMPFVYLGCSIAILFGNAQVKLYDVSSNIEAKISETSGYGYITFDRKYNYVGANKAAMNFFKDIEKCRVDAPIITDDYVLRDLIRWVKKNAVVEETDENKLHTDVYMNKIGGENIHLQCDMSYIRFGVKKKVMGYILELHDDTIQNKYIHELNYQGMRFKQEADRQTRRNKTLQNSTILGMASMIESRDNSTGGHITRTSSCVSLFVEELKKRNIYKVSETYWDNVINAAPLHDLGKIAVDDYILRKPSSFTDDEYKKMKTHATEGARIVRQVLKDADDREFIKIAENVAHYHHEKFNGTGYPERLRGEKIPLEARIMAIADVFDALASKRYYKEPMTYDEAFKIIKDSSGSHFDPELAKIFFELEPKIIELYESFEGTEYHR